MLGAVISAVSAIQLIILSGETVSTQSAKPRFSALSLEPALLANLEQLGYQFMTPIQAEALPSVIAGKDVLGKARTGSGKTATFGLGLLHHLQVERYRVQSLVLCPTRELADQVAGEIRRLARSIHNIKVLTLCGGMPFGPQVGSLEHGAHIIVGTPGRVEEHVRKGNLDLSHVTSLVLDEADRMLDMGFQESLSNIVADIPTQRQTLLFSATFPPAIEQLAKSMMQSPVTVEIEEGHNRQTIDQTLYKVSDEFSRVDVVQLLLQEYEPESCVVFCNTKRETQMVADELSASGFVALALHGDLEQKQRDQTLVRFANKSATVLVATDVAARGLDIEAVDLVTNYQIARELEVHVHRIGRTGRAGASGQACTLFSDKEAYKVELLESYLEQSIASKPLPDKRLLRKPAYLPAMATIQIGGGKKQKVRPGDIVGALTGEQGIKADQIGKIQVGDQWAYVAVEADLLRTAINKLANGKIKGRKFKARKLH